jgi:hypothetical protein
MEALSDAQRTTLAAVLDEIVPPRGDGRLPGAGALGLAAGVEAFVRRTPGAVAALARALDALAASGFGALRGAARTQALHDFDAKQPGFAAGLVAPTYVGYYQEPRVLAALGLAPRPPHPEGHALEAGDLAGLEAVRRRGKIYRDC